MELSTAEYELLTAIEAHVRERTHCRKPLNRKKVFDLLKKLEFVRLYGEMPEEDEELPWVG